MTSNHKTKLRLPFAGQWLVMNGGDSKEVNHHSGIRPQNYAFDFKIIDDNGRDFKIDGKESNDYYAFGQPILTPADGTIVEAVDGVRDNEPGFGNYLAGAGNFIIIQHQPDEFSFIAHLKQGSVKVKPGESVKTGQQLGECGNSGQSFERHVHYHLQDSIVFDQYKVTYADQDRRKAPFPAVLDIEKYVAGGIKAYFSNIKVTGEKEVRKLYSPVRGDIVSNVDL